MEHERLRMWRREAEQEENMSTTGEAEGIKASIRGEVEGTKASRWREVEGRPRDSKEGMCSGESLAPQMRKLRQLRSVKRTRTVEL